MITRNEFGRLEPMLLGVAFRAFPWEISFNFRSEILQFSVHLISSLCNITRMHWFSFKLVAVVTIDFYCIDCPRGNYELSARFTRNCSASKISPIWSTSTFSAAIRSFNFSQPISIGADRPSDMGGALEVPAPRGSDPP